MKTWQIDQDSYLTPEGTEVPSSHPLQDVLGANRWSTTSRNRPMLMTPGDTLRLSPGGHKHFRITHTYDDGPVINPRTLIIGESGTTIEPNPVGGSQTLYVEWGGGYTFRDMTLIGDDIAAFFTEHPTAKRWQGNHPGFRDLHFRNVHVDGGFDFDANRGPKNKWGTLAYELGRSAHEEPGFTWHMGRIGGIYKEHAFYLHNTIGDCSFQHLHIRGCGRTAFQFASRDSEGPQGKGDVYLGDSLIEDVCLEQSGGGSAVTVKGNHDGTFFLRNVKIKLGCNPGLHEKFRNNITGCIVTHRGEDGPKPSLVIGAGCRFIVGTHWQGKGPARRPNLNISNLKRFKMRNSFVWSHPDAREALRLDPTTIYEIVLDDTNEVYGDCFWGSTRYSDDNHDGQGYRDMIEAEL